MARSLSDLKICGPFTLIVTQVWNLGGSIAMSREVKLLVFSEATKFKEKPQILEQELVWKVGDKQEKSA